MVIKVLSSTSFGGEIIKVRVVNFVIRMSNLVAIGALDFTSF